MTAIFMPETEMRFFSDFANRNFRPPIHLDDCYHFVLPKRADSFEYGAKKNARRQNSQYRVVVIFRPTATHEKLVWKYDDVKVEYFEKIKIADALGKEPGVRHE